MRIISATVAAVVISVGQAALAQNLQRPDEDAATAGMPSDDAQAGAVVVDDTPMTADVLVARLPSRRLVVHAAPKLTAEELVAGLPQAPVAAAPPDDMQPTAAELLAQLPERPLKAGTVTARQVVAQLPERPVAAAAEADGYAGSRTAEAMPEPTAQEIVAQLPERRLAAPKPTAREVLAQLPERRLAAPKPTAQEVLAQLPERRLAKPKPTAAEILAQLPERPVIVPMPEIVVPVVHEAAAEATDEHPDREPEAMSPEVRDVTGETDMPADPRYSTLDEPNLGTAVDIPRAVFSMADGAAWKGVGRRYKTHDSRAKMAVWTDHPKSKHETAKSYLHRAFKIPRQTVDYERYAADYGVISGLYGTRVYYIRCNVSKRTGNFHCVDLAYPAREREHWDQVVTRIGRSLHASDEANLNVPTALP